MLKPSGAGFVQVHPCFDLAPLPVINRDTVDLLAQVTIQVADEGIQDLPLVSAAIVRIKETATQVFIFPPAGLAMQLIRFEANRCRNGEKVAGELESWQGADGGKLR